MSELHVVLGAGQVGPVLAERLLEDGKTIRVVRRSLVTGGREDIDWVQADLSRTEEAITACEGATVIYDCTNPAGYGSWHETLEPLKAGVLAAAIETGALLVVLDNLYMYGRPDGELTESTPMDPCSDKGSLRKKIAQDVLDASSRGEARIAVGRASDFFGPGAGEMSFFGGPFVRRLAAGWGAIALGNPDLPRSYSYVPDVARGLAALGQHPELSEGRVFHLPVAHKSASTRNLVERFAAALDVRPRMLRLPRWFFRAASLFSKDLGAMTEMLYQWEVPFVVDDIRFVTTFGFGATPMHAAIEESIEAAGLSRAARIRLAA